MSNTSKTSFSADFFLLKNERDIALRRLYFLKRGLIKLKTESVSADVSSAVDYLLGWFDCPIMLDSDFGDHDDYVL